MTITTFIGNIGGQLGLWLGASIISLLKLIILLLPILYHYCFSKKTGNKNKGNNAETNKSTLKNDQDDL